MSNLDYGVEANLKNASCDKIRWMTGDLRIWVRQLYPSDKSMTDESGTDSFAAQMQEGGS